ELGTLQSVKPGTQRVVRQPGDGMQQWKWNTPADNGGNLQQPFIVEPEAIDACSQHDLNSWGHFDGFDRAVQVIAGRRAYQGFRLYQRADRLFQKEWIAAPNEEPLERCQSGVVAKKRIEQPSSFFSREWIEPGLSVVGLAGPAMMVFWAVGGEQQQAD